jgi:hypothetical protein
MAIAKAGAAALVVAALGSGPLLAAEGFSVIATAYHEVPAAANFEIQVADDSELAYEVEQLVQASLQRQGYGFAVGSPLVLTVMTERTEPSADTPWPMQLGASKGGLRMRLFLFGTNSSGLLQDRSTPTAGEYRVSLAVHDRRTRGYLWRGMATTCQCGQGILSSSREMVPALVEAIGRSVVPQATVFGAAE